MNSREKFSTILLCLGLILALLPLTSGRQLIVKPQKLLALVLNDTNFISVDNVAKLVVNEDSTFQLIDLRTPKEYKMMNIPGSVNIPYSNLIEKDQSIAFNNGKTRYIIYSNGDMNSNYALVILKGQNFRNIYVMKGGMNEWYNLIMNSHFTGERISARENALFETRKSAKILFTQMNGLPDSVKQKFILANHAAAKKLDGGCE